MKNSLVRCPTCKRHIYAAESSCPFCTRQTSASSSVLAAALTAGLAIAGCGSETTQNRPVEVAPPPDTPQDQPKEIAEDPKQEPVNVAPAYGAPPMPSPAAYGGPPPMNPVPIPQPKP